MKDTDGSEVTHLTDEYLDHVYEYQYMGEGKDEKGKPITKEQGRHSLRELIGEDGFVPIAVHTEKCTCKTCKVQ